MKFLLSALVGVLMIALAPLPVPAAHAQAGDSGSQLTRIEVSRITPSVVRADGPPVLTVTGRLTNTSNRTISDVETRIQRGSPVRGAGDVRRALDGRASVTQAQNPFTRIAGKLTPGQQVPFELKVPLSGGPDSLRIPQPGAYPLMINVNGVPDYGNRARVAEARFLLPVVAPPGAAPAPPPAQPTPVTVLVPLIDYPRVEQEPTPGHPAILVDDRIAAELAPGGRLFDLVQAVEEAAPPGSPVGSALCFAIDPDLLTTVLSMQDGYLVRQPDGSTRPGSGAGAAKFWLSKLRDVTEGRCVIPVPHSDADVVALGRAGLPDLIQGALDGTALIRDTLQVEPRRDVLWPIDGALDEPAAAQLTGLGIENVLMRPGALHLPGGSLAPARVGTSTGDWLNALPIDPLVSDALDPLRNAGVRNATRLSPGQDGSLSVANTLGAMTFRATAGSKGGATSVLAPPRRWNLNAEDMRSLLEGMGRLARGGYVTPASLPAPQGTGQGSEQAESPEQSSSGAAAPASTPTHAASPEGAGSPPRHSGDREPVTELAYPVTSATEEIRQPMLDDLAAINYVVGDLFRSMRKETAAGVEPAQLSNPLRNGLLRSVSSAWRGDPAAARWWLGKAEEQIGTMRSSVGIDEFNGQVTLAASNSPIPLTVTNKLPVTMFIRLNVATPQGIEVQDLGLLRIPPQGSRQFFLETELARAGKFSVDVTVRTEGGTQLGRTHRVQLDSNAYGTITLVLTASAAGLLVVLSTLRILRRVRSSRKPGRRRTGTGPQPAAPSEEAGAGRGGQVPAGPDGPAGTENPDRS